MVGLAVASSPSYYPEGNAGKSGDDAKRVTNKILGALTDGVPISIGANVNPTFYPEGHTGSPNDDQLRVLQKILGLLHDGIIITGGGGGSVSWGGINGTLSNQADLVAALAAKQAADFDLTTLSINGVDSLFRNPAKLTAYQVDSRLSGQTAGSASQNLYSSRDDTGSGAYVRNPVWFGHDVDVTAISVYADENVPATSTPRCVTLVAPNVGITAHHVSVTVGKHYRFADSGGLPTTLTVSAVLQVGSTDIDVVLFSASAPAGITPMKVLTAAQLAQLSTGSPILYLNQNQKIFVGDRADTLPAINLGLPTEANRSSFFVDAILGDSGHPMFTILDGQAYLLATLNSITYGDAIAASYATVNSQMLALPSTAQLTPWGGSAFPIIGSSLQAGQIEAWSAILDTWAGKTPYSGTLVIPFIKTATINNSLTFTGTDGSTLNVGVGGTLGSNAFNSTSFVPQTTTVNGHALSGNVTVTPTDLSLVIGTNVQAFDPDLTTWAGITPGTNVGAFLTTPTVANLKAALSDETTLVGNLFSLANPSAISFIKIAADNTVSTRTPAQLLTDLSGAAGADFSLNSHKLTNVSDPSGAQDAMTLNYLTNTYIPPAYTAATAPVGVPFFVSVSGVSMTSVAVTDLFTVPSGKTCICLLSVGQITSVTGAAISMPRVQIIESGAAGPMIQATVAQGTVTPTVGYALGNAIGSTATIPNKVCTAGNKVQVSVITSNTSTTCVASFGGIFLYVP